jgi:hypothetical protein
MTEPVHAQHASPPTAPVIGAIARLASAWCAALAFGVVFVLAALRGVDVTYALERALLAALGGWVLGRLVGHWAGSHIAPALLRTKSSTDA